MISSDKKRSDATAVARRSIDAHKTLDKDEVGNAAMRRVRRGTAWDRRALNLLMREWRRVSPLRLMSFGMHSAPNGRAMVVIIDDDDAEDD